MLFPATRTPSSGIRLRPAATVLRPIGAGISGAAIVVIGTSTLLDTDPGGPRGVIWADRPSNS